MVVPAYPPYQQPILDRQTGLVTTPWQLFFLALGRAAAEGAGAPIDAEYLVAAPDPRLTDERVVVTTPTISWQLTEPGEARAHVVDGSITFEKLAPIEAPHLLGRGTAGLGPIELIAIGDGLTLDGTTLSATGEGVESAGYWTPITNGDPLSPEILFDAEGDCVVGFVPTP